MSSFTGEEPTLAGGSSLFPLISISRALDTSKSVLVLSHAWEEESSTKSAMQKRDCLERLYSHMTHLLRENHSAIPLYPLPGV